MSRGPWRMSGYRVEELLGAGSSAEVWRGRVQSTGVPVALKRIWLADRRSAESAIAEAAILATLDHPHLVKLHEVRRVGDDVVLVLDLAAAGSLAELLARRGRLTVGEVITALAPIGTAVAYAHTAAIVHGDVTPANVLFTEAGLPLLADLGVARLLGEGSPVRTTPAYADPLVAAGAVPGSASDVFMLGAVALHALTGAPPWPGPDPSAALARAATGDEPDFADRLVSADAPEEVREVVLRALALDPARRGTATDFALDLRHAAEPVAVELTAGRGRRSPASTSTGARGGSGPVAQGRLPLTVGVRAPAPFGDRGGRHQAVARARRQPARRRVIAAAALAVLGAVALALCWPSSDQHAFSEHPATTVRPLPSRSMTTTPTSGSSRPHGAPSPVIALLARLDSARAHAFAIRQPAALRAVYASAGLLARDRALLTAIVPPGCGLLGVHTRFRDAVVESRSRTALVLRVRARLDRSRLVCSGTVTGRARAGPVTLVRLRLVHGAGGYRIARQEPVATP